VTGAVQTRALLICDSAFQQAGTNKWHVIGVFNQILVRELPATHGPLVVFCSLVGFAGDALVMATIRDNAGEVVHALRAMFPKVPPRVFEFAFPFPPVTFQKAGSHVLELHVGGELLSIRSFGVQIAPIPGPPGPAFGPG
jgi:hypothetical protein